MADYDWMEEAREIAAQCWCDPETSHIEMDAVLAEAVAKRIAAWMQASAEYARNADFYRELLKQCGEIIGERAFMADDGTIMEDVLCLRIPEILAIDYKCR